MDIVANAENRRQMRANRKCDKARASSGEDCIRRNIKCVRFSVDPLKRRRNILCSLHFEWYDFKAEPASNNFNLSHL